MDPEATPPVQSANDQLPPLEPAKKPSFWANVPRKRLIGVSIAALAVLAAALGIGLAYKGQTSKPTGCSDNSCNTNDAVSPKTSSTPAPTPTPTPVARLLDGALVTPGEENVRPLGVMIENHPDARPQSGLADANWVYEAIAEGGITRFFALYANPDQVDVRVGPVRSVRTYYLDYAREYNAFLAHVGGNIDALDSIKASGGVTDLDQFGIGEPVYKRDFSRNVATEHTMYSSTKNLWGYITDKNYDKTASFAPLLFIDDIPTTARPAAQTVSINFSTPTFAVKWTYDSATNSYTRTMAGQPHKDAVTGQQITAKNIVIQTVARKSTVTRINEQGWIYTLTGSGKVTVVQNGTSITGTWKRDGNGRTRYYADDGSEIKLVRGTTWVEVVHPDLSNAFSVS
jgi:hypothetical protein